MACAVATPHAAHLRKGDVAFIDDHEVVVREIIQEAKGAGAGFAAVEKARIVFNAGAIAQFFDHFEVEGGAFFDAPGFGVAPFREESIFPAPSFLRLGCCG